MLSHFTKVKLSWSRRQRAVVRPDFDRLEPVAGHLPRRFSCRAQIGQPFQVPTDTFELQFQPIGFVSHIAHPPVARAPLPPPKHFLNLAADGTEEPVDANRRRAQFSPGFQVLSNHGSSAPLMRKIVFQPLPGTVCNQLDS
jgi:hypothetical protein